jgi:hypothetical protein
VNRKAVHLTYMRAAALCPTSRYPYGGMAYAHPDAVTQLTHDRGARRSRRTCDSIEFIEHTATKDLASSEYLLRRSQGKPSRVSLDFRIVVVAEMSDAIDAEARC